MAKNNLLLGSAAGSVGDVTLMRRQGVQVSRVRVRSIANPKTFGQAQQRCYMAPIPKFYAPLAIALEKSWEGKSKSESYSAFLKKNAQLARENNWTLPKGTGFFPMPYRLSKGTLPSVNAKLVPTDRTSIRILGNFESTFDSGTFGEFSKDIINNLGLENGDQLTFIIITKAGDGIYIPTYFRLYLDVNSNENYEQIFQAFGFYGVEATNTYVNFTYDNYLQGLMGVAVIASRWENNMWRRSIESLDVAPEILAAIAGPDVAAANIATYMNSATANPSDVYLNGSAE